MSLNFPASPSNGDTYENYVYDATSGVWKRLTPSVDLGINNLNDVDLTTPAMGDSLVYNGTDWVNGPRSGNAIINGDFGVWQRGTSFTSSPGRTFTADRWGIIPSLGSATVTRESFSPADLSAIGYGDAEYYLRTDISSPGDIYLDQYIEDVRTFSDQEVTLSFWIRSSSATKLDRVFVRQIFGGAQPSVTLSTGVNEPISSNWTRKSFTFSVPSIAGKTINSGNHLQVRIDFDQTSTGPVDVWGVQLEAGSVATPFRLAGGGSKAAELALCQRYYFEYDPISTTGIGTGYSFSSTSFRGFFTCPVPMRSAPTFAEPTSSSLRIQLNGSTYTPSSFNSIEALPSQISIIANTSGMPSGHAGIFSTPERVTFDAEL